MQAPLKKLCKTLKLKTLYNSSCDEDEFWMQQALKLAKYGETQGEVPVGALAVQYNRLIAVGWNQPILQHDPTAHAEIIALREAGKELQNYRLPEVTLYVTLEPCPMCVGAMVHARILRLVYGASDLKTGAVCSAFNLLQSPKLNHKVITHSGVLADSCSEIMRLFFKQRRLK